MTNELVRQPFVVERAEGLVDIVFEAKAGSRLWKDVMVAFVRDIPTGTGLVRECFYDLVADSPHRGSLPDPA